VDGAQVIQVSNNPYVLTRLGGGFGTRPRVDSGRLGIAAVHITRDADVARFVALHSAGRLGAFEGWLEWSAPRFEVRSSGPVEAGVDGEAMLLEPPLMFEARPGAVRVRVPTHAPGSSPAASRQDRSPTDTARALLAVLVGRPAPVIGERS
jgi:diacylglycerol kinase family enzyme